MGQKSANVLVILRDECIHQLSRLEEAREMNLVSGWDSCLGYPHLIVCDLHSGASKPLSIGTMVPEDLSSQNKKLYAVLKFSIMSTVRITNSIKMSPVVVISR
ncbi:hypothetical protein CRE_26712 [Caenorhabditis remanei]|uniref:Uncharacterized protein n=1 Tax=Caenorhabditis remanei TaxID=31234 RepID=E3MXT5_CAERE|nr:hypothetical protein CRE_26712 [Caenorhabditis remanei]